MRFVPLRYARSAGLPAILLCAFLATGGCAELVQRETKPTAAQGAASLDRLVFERRLLDLAEYATAEVANVVGQIALDDASPDARLRSQSILGRVATTTAAIATREDSPTALLDLLIYLRLERGVTEAWLATAPVPSSEATHGPALLSAFDRAASYADTLAATTFTAEERALVDDAVARWRENHPNASFVGIVRLADFLRAQQGDIRAQPVERMITRSMFAPVTEAQQELLRTRLFGERIAFLLRRMPYIIRWQSEEAAYRFLDQPEIAELERSLAEGTTAIGQLASSIDQARAVAVEIETAITGLEPGDLAPARELASEIRLTLADAKEILPEAQRTIGELREAIAGAERVSSSLRELTRGPDGAPIDLSGIAAASERFVTAAADLRAAMQQANALLSSDDATQRLAELTDTGKKGIDHIIWRIALLMVIAAALSMVLMVVRSLTRQRMEPAERARRTP
jgi:hypothetical protein